MKQKNHSNENKRDDCRLLAPLLLWTSQARIQGPMRIQFASKNLVRQFATLFIRQPGCTPPYSLSRPVWIPSHGQQRGKPTPSLQPWRYHFHSSAQQYKIKAEPLVEAVKPSKRNPWTETEDKIIRDSLKQGRRGGVQWARSQLPLRTHEAVKVRRSRFRDIKTTIRPWTEEENQIILNSIAVPHGLKSALSQLPSRTYDAVRIRRQGIVDQDSPRREHKIWNPEELQTVEYLLSQNAQAFELRSHFPTRTLDGLLRQYLKMKATMGLKEKKRKMKTYNPKKHRPWTLEEDDRIREEFNRLQKPGSSFDQVLVRLLFDPKWDRHGDTTRRRMKKIMAQKTGQYTPSYVPWTSEEETRAMAAVADQIGPGHRPQLSFQEPDVVNTKRSCDLPHVRGKIISYDDDKPYLSPNSPELGQIDWQVVASRVQSRSPGTCRVRFYDNLSIRSRKPWSTDESERLFKGLAMHGPNSLSLAQFVRTRSPRQCMRKLWLENKRNQENKSTLDDK